MRRFWLIPLVLALPTAALLLEVPPEPAAAQQPELEPETGEDEVAAPEKLGRLTLTLDAGGHTGAINKVFFPSARRLITSSADGSIRIWDPQTGQTRHVVRLPGTLQATAVALSFDGETLAAGCRYDAAKEGKPMIYLVGVADGRIRRVIHSGHAGKVRALAFSQDGKRLASSSLSDSTIEIVNLDKDKPAQVIKTAGPVVALAFSPDGKRLAEARQDGFSIRGLAGGKITRLPGGYLAAPSRITSDCVAWSRDGKTVATAARDGLRLFDPNGKERFHLGKGADKAKLKNKPWPRAVAFSLDSSRVVVTWHNMPASVFNVKTGDPVASLSPDADASLGVQRNSTFAPGGKVVVTVGGHQGTHALLFWKAADGSETRRLGAKSWLTGTELQAGWNADGTTVSWRSAKSKGVPGSFDLAALELRPARPGEAFGAVHKQGPLSLVVQDKDTVQLLKGKKPVFPLTIPGERRVGDHMTFLGNKRAIVGESGFGVSVFDITGTTGKYLRSLRHDGAIRGLAPSPKGPYLLSFSFGQRLHIWNLERQPKPLLTLYVSGRDWIIWNDKGYYAATPGGERLMGWTVDNGIDKETTYYPSERFRKQMYRPDVIKLILEKGDLASALASANAALKKEGKLVADGVADLEELLPPRVELPTVNQAKLPTIKVTARAAAAVAKQPVIALRLLVDGRPWPGAVKEFKAGTKAEAEWTLDLPHGTHSLSVLARSPASFSISDSVEVTFINKQALPNLHVLTIGVSQYQQANLALKFAANDATQLLASFRKNAVGKLFADVLGESLVNKNASRHRVLEEIAKLRAAKPNDLAVVFFAGHGVKDKDKFYLLTVEANPNDPKDPDSLAKSAISGEELRKALGDFPCQVLLMIDACHSAAGVKNFLRAVDDVSRNLTDEDCGIAVMCAAMANEVAFEKPGVNGGNGLFTKFVLEALEGGPKVPRSPLNQQVYLHHLQSYVFDHVSLHSEDKQHPFLNLPWSVASFPLR